MSIPDVVIIAGARTPFARINGNLAGQTAVELGTIAIRGALERAGVSPDDIDAVIMGQVLQAGAGQNPAKQAAVAAGCRGGCAPDQCDGRGGDDGRREVLLRNPHVNASQQ